jgi:protease IV
MRKHPVIFGIVLLCIMGVAFFIAVFGMGYLAKDHRGFSLGNKVGIVTVEGIITDAADVVAQLAEFGDDEKIRAIVLRIDSPGGGVAPAQEIYDAVSDLKKKKKVVASMGSYAASGGYLIACAADMIVANPGTITGSISAVMHFVNTEELLKKVGLRTSVVKSGKYKDMGTPLRGMTPEEEVLLQGIVDDVSDQFVECVSRDRKIDKEEVRKIADGRVFTGRQAMKLKLVDVLGDMRSAVRLAGKMAGMTGEPDVVHAGKEKQSFWELVLRDMAWRITEQAFERRGAGMGISYLWER